MSDIVKAEPQELALPEQMKYAEIVTQGYMVPQAYRNKPANALIAIGLGQAMGLSPAESLYRIDVIQGKPSASAELIAANVRKAGHLLRVETDAPNMRVTATIYRADDPEYPHTVTRDMDWAKSMGLATKDQWKKQPLTMLEWRAISACARKACSEALYGVTYVTGEVETPRRPAVPAQDSALSRLMPQAEPETIDPELAEDPADQPPTIPDQVRATVARVKGTPGATDYIAWLKDEGAPEHILNYARHELEEQQ